MPRNPVGLIVMLALAILAAPLAAADKEQAAKVFRIGVLGLTSVAAVTNRLEGFRRGLRERGWIEGRNIVFEYRWAEGEANRLPALAAELVSLKVDLIVSWETISSRAAKEATRTIPIVMAAGSDPVGAGIVHNLAHPGGNVTGVTSMNVELTGKRLEMLKEAIPGLSRVAVLAQAGSPATPLSLEVMEAAARALGIQLQILEIGGLDDFDSAFAAATRGHAEALTMVTSAFFFGGPNNKRLADFAAKHRLPAISPYREFAEAGGLMAYGVNMVELSRHAATYVDKIFKGANPGDLPVERPTRFELVINLKTAKTLGITIPPTLLVLADEVLR